MHFDFVSDSVVHQFEDIVLVHFYFFLAFEDVVKVPPYFHSQLLWHFLLNHELIDIDHLLSVCALHLVELTHDVTNRVDCVSEDSATQDHHGHCCTSLSLCDRNDITIANRGHGS